MSEIIQNIVVGGKALVNSQGVHVKHGDVVSCPKERGGSGCAYRVVGGNPDNEDVSVQLLGSGRFAEPFHVKVFDLKWAVHSGGPDTCSKYRIVTKNGMIEIHGRERLVEHVATTEGLTIVGIREQTKGGIYLHRALVGQPLIKGLVGPMWDGDAVRYESGEVYDLMSQ